MPTINETLQNFLLSSILVVAMGQFGENKTIVHIPFCQHFVQKKVIRRKKNRQRKQIDHSGTGDDIHHIKRYDEENEK